MHNRKYFVIARRPVIDRAVTGYYDLVEDDSDFDDVEVDVAVHRVQEYFKLSVLEGRSLHDLDEIYDGPAKRFQVCFKDSLEEVEQYLNALEITPESEYTPKNSEKLLSTPVSHAVLVVPSYYDINSKLAALDGQCFFLQPECYIHPTSLELDSAERELKMLRLQCEADSDNADLAVRAWAQSESVKRLERELNQQLDSRFVAFALSWPRQEEEQQVTAGQALESPRLLARSGSGLFNLNNDNNAPYYDGKGKQEEDECRQAPRHN